MVEFLIFALQNVGQFFHIKLAIFMSHAILSSIRTSVFDLMPC